jgi:hypothetical protein
LAPAFDVDEAIDPETVRQMLVSGNMGLATIHLPNAAGVAIFHPGTFDGKYGLWIPYIAGRVRGGPKLWLRTMRGIMDHFVEQARKAGCEIVRIGGRDYRRVFPDFEPCDPDHPNRLQKVL